MGRGSSFLFGALFSEERTIRHGIPDLQLPALHPSVVSAQPPPADLLPPLQVSLLEPTAKGQTSGIGRSDPSPALRAL